MVHSKWRSYVSFLHGKKVLLLSLFAALLILSLISARSIELKTRIEDMLPNDNHVAVSYREIGEKFNTSSILITVEKGPRNRMEAAADRLIHLLTHDNRFEGRFRSVRTRMDRDFIIDKGLLLMEMEDLKDYRKMTADPGLLPFVRVLNDNLESAWLDGEGEDVISPSHESDMLDSFNRMENFTTALTRWIDEGGAGDESLAQDLIDTLFVGDPYFYSSDYEMLVIQVSPDFSLGDRKILSQVIRDIRDVIAVLENEYGDLRFGVSGDVAQEADEEAALGFDALYPALAALLVILVLFYFSLSGLIPVLLTLLTLVAGIILDLGIIGLTLKELNMITSSFGALLVGLGIDFGIHIITRYGDYLGREDSPIEAMAMALEETVPPVAIGGVTTALAFFALCLSATKGFVQFGIVAGCGILLVLAAMFSLLPLLLLSFYRQSGRADRFRFSFQWLSHWGDTLKGKAGIAVASLVFILSAGSFFLLPGLSYDYDMRRIGPQNTPSKETENRIMEAYGLSPFPAFLQVSSLDRADELTELLRDDKTVSTVSSPSDFLPPVMEQKKRLAYIADWHENLSTEEYSELEDQGIYYFYDEIQRLEWNLIEIADISSVNLGEESRILFKRDAMIREILGSERGKPGREIFQKLMLRLENSDNREKIREINRTFANALSERIIRMTDLDTPVSISDLPFSIREEMISSNGQEYLITLYPTDESVSPDGMLRFNNAIEDIDPSITGTISLSLALSREILRETRRSALAVLSVVVVFLLIMFRSPVKTVLALISLVSGIVLMMGIYSLIDQMNLINILAVPLIIGIAIDYNVHMIHSLDRGEPLKKVMSLTGKSILLSALTTMIGFGSLALLGTFRGIATLGILLFLGTLTSLITSLTIIPFLYLRIPGNKGRQKKYIQEEIHEF